MKRQPRRLGTDFDPEHRACSFETVARQMRLTIDRVRVLESNALQKLKRQKVRDQVARWAELVRLAAEARRWSSSGGTRSASSRTNNPRCSV
jgi:hypothetical protein